MSGERTTLETVPPALLAYDQWICWREEDRNGKATKVPIDPNNGEFASTTDPDTWDTFQEAREWAKNGEVEGLGFVFTSDDPIVGVDLDSCRVPETASTASWADDIIDRLDSYTEVSPSGTGFHILVEGSLPGDRNRNGDVEMYDAARFFTVTGDHVAGTPSEIADRTDALADVYTAYIDADDESAETPRERPPKSGADLDDAELVQKATDASNGEKFARLWRGSTSGYESHSEADMALCSLLAFWTGGNPEQMDRLFRDSGLMREKWDEVHFADGSTYGEKTIDRAIAGSSEFYDPAERSSNAAAEGPDPARLFDRMSLGEGYRTEDVAELEQRVAALIDEKESLASELARERERRRGLEDELQQLSEEEDHRWFRWFSELV